MGLGHQAKGFQAVTCTAVYQFCCQVYSSISVLWGDVEEIVVPTKWQMEDGEFLSGCASRCTAYVVESCFAAVSAIVLVLIR